MHGHRLRRASGEGRLGGVTAWPGARVNETLGPPRVSAARCLLPGELGAGLWVRSPPGPTRGRWSRGQGWGDRPRTS